MCMLCWSLICVSLNVWNKWDACSSSCACSQPDQACAFASSRLLGCAACVCCSTWCIILCGLHIEQNEAVSTTLCSHSCIMYVVPNSRVDFIYRAWFPHYWERTLQVEVTICIDSHSYVLDFYQVEQTFYVKKNVLSQLADCGSNTQSIQHSLYIDPTQHIRIAILSSVQNQHLLFTFCHASIRNHKWNAYPHRYVYRQTYEPAGQNIDVPDQKCSHAPKNMKIWEHVDQHVY